MYLLAGLSAAVASAEADVSRCRAGGQAAKAVQARGAGRLLASGLHIVVAVVVLALPGSI
jgi:hypothetical protein